MTALARGKERRRLLVEGQVERRRSAADRRRCPDCKGAVLEKVTNAPGGHWFTQFCAKCGWKTQGKRILRDAAVKAMTCSGIALVRPNTSHIVIPPTVLNFGNVRDESKVTFRPVFKTGAKHGSVWEISFN